MVLQTYERAPGKDERPFGGNSSFDASESCSQYADAKEIMSIILAGMVFIVVEGIQGYCGLDDLLRRLCAAGRY